MNHKVVAHSDTNYTFDNLRHTLNILLQVIDISGNHLENMKGKIII